MKKDEDAVAAQVIVGPIQYHELLMGLIQLWSTLSRPQIPSV